MSGRRRLNIIIMIIISLGIAWGMKYHYSHSTSDDLCWILAPTAYLVEMAGDLTFEKESNTGYVDHESGIIIAPACSGVNFMIIVFCLSAYTGLKRIKTATRQFMWIIAGIAGSYIYTLLVNTFRISLSIYSIRTDLFQAWLSGETVHLLEGVLVYFIFLLIYNYLLNKLINTDYINTAVKPFITIKRFYLPLTFYLSFTLLLPVLNHGGLPQSNGFTRYTLIILLGCTIVFALFFLLKVCCHYCAVRVK